MPRERKDKSYPDNMYFETQLWEKGYQFIAGIDDVGRGCFAGPVATAAVIMPRDLKIHRLTDSKLVKNELQYFSDLVKENALAWAVGYASVEEVDELNIKYATQLAMKRAVEALDITPEYLLIDGLEKVDLAIPQRPITKGDFVVHGISAASVIAKLHRDNLMAQLDEEFGNVYGWAKNAGYPTKSHVEAARQHGITKYHRKTWGTMENI